MKEPRTLLMVDDSEDNLFLMRSAFEMAKCHHPLQEVHDGEEAIAYLSGEGPYEDRKMFPLPTVMLLDLNMPKKGGFEVLTWVRAHPVLKRLTVIILTASMRREDVVRSFDLGANSVLVKPASLATLVEMMRTLCAWVEISQFPSLMEAGGNEKHRQQGK